MSRWDVAQRPTEAAAETERWTVPTGHQRPPPPLKRWTKLLPAYGAHAS